MIQTDQRRRCLQVRPGFACRLSLCAAVLSGSVQSAKAGSNVFLTPVADLGPLPIAGSSGYGDIPAGTDWMSYIVGVSTDDGSKIQAVDVNLKGPFGQTWNWDSDASSFASTPSSLSVTGGDSHLMLPASALSAVNPTEDINATPAPASAGMGVGSSMRGVWGVPGIENGLTSMNLAYLVMPRAMESQLEYAIDGFDGFGNTLFQFRQGASFPSPPPPLPLPPPVVEPPAGASTPPLVIPPPATPEVPINPPVVPEQPSVTIDPPDPGVAEPVLPSNTIEVVKVLPPNGSVATGGIWTIAVAGEPLQVRLFMYDKLWPAGNPATDTLNAEQPRMMYFSSGGLNGALTAALRGLATGLVPTPNFSQPLAMAGPEPAAAPEPASILLMGVGGVGLIALARRR